MQLAREPLEHGARVAILAAKQRDRLAEHAHRRDAAAQLMSEQRYVVWRNRLIGVRSATAFGAHAGRHGGTTESSPSCSLWMVNVLRRDPPAHLKN